MEVILKSLLSQRPDCTETLINRVLDKDNQGIFSTQEQKVFEYLNNIFSSTETLPSEEMFLKEFPEYTVPLERAQPLIGDDLKIHMTLLMQKRNNQKASSVLMEAARRVVDEGYTYEVADLVHSIKVIDENELEEESTVSSADAFKAYYEKKKSSSSGLLTFVSEIDEKIGGLPMGGVSVIFGYTSQFKSLLTNNIAYNNAKKLNYNICMISLEVSKEDVMINLLARHSYDPKFTKYPSIPHSKIRDCKLSPEEEEYLFGTIAPDFYSEGGRIEILDETDFKTFSFAEIRAKLEKVDDKFIRETGYGIDAITWDHANLFKFNGSSGKKQSEGAEINEYVSFIRKLSIAFRRMPGEKEFRKIHSIIVAQANREGFKRANKLKGVYDLRAISEANELERGSMMIFSIYTNEDLKAAKEATMQILKNRTGAVMYDPTSIFVDPVCYVAGEAVEGFQEMLNMEDMDNIFETDSLNGLFD